MSPSPPLRALAMEPARFDGQKVTITGQFRGRNLFGDLPEAPAQNRFQFVLRSGDAAVWVMGLQSKGKTFNFDPEQAHRHRPLGQGAGHRRTARRDYVARWHEHRTGAAPEETTEVAIDLPPPPPVEILFTAPAEGEADVRSTERIRMQLSRDLDPETLKDRVRLPTRADSRGGEAHRPRSRSRRTTRKKIARSKFGRPTACAVPPREDGNPGRRERNRRRPDGAVHADLHDGRVLRGLTGLGASGLAPVRTIRKP